MRNVLVAPDKFRGTATASEVIQAISVAAAPFGWEIDAVPMADGGEGTLEVITNGRRRVTQVTGPLGNPIEAEWVLRGDVAVIEMAKASGLLLAGGPEHNNPLEATTQGTGELIAAALKAGAKEIVVGLGGSATTDGGLGCVKALWPHSRLAEVELIAATDVQTLFLDAAREFGPQKGATQAQVALLEKRLQRVADEYQKQFNIDITTIPGSGAAGGLGGGLVAVGGSIVSGFEYLADLVELDERMENAELVITGEGCFDENSLNGKVVGGVIAMAEKLRLPVLVIAGQVLYDISQTHPNVTVISMSDAFGVSVSMNYPMECINQIIAKFAAS